MRNLILFVLISLSVFPFSGFAQRGEIPQMPRFTQQSNESFWCFVGNPLDFGACTMSRTDCEQIRQDEFDNGRTEQMACHRQTEAWCLEFMFQDEPTVFCFSNRSALNAQIRGLQSVNREIPRTFNGLKPFRWFVCDRQCRDELEEMRTL